MWVDIFISAAMFKQIERLAARTGRSTSRVFTDALREYLAQHSPDDEITAAVNRACAEIGSSLEPLSVAVAQSILARTEY